MYILWHNVQCTYFGTMYNVHTLVQCTMYILWHNVQCTYFGTMYNVHTLAQCTMYILWYNVQCIYFGTMYNVHELSRVTRELYKSSEDVYYWLSFNAGQYKFLVIFLSK